MAGIPSPGHAEQNGDCQNDAAYRKNHTAYRRKKTFHGLASPGGSDGQ
jgi:hypothetical protein